MAEAATGCPRCGASRKGAGTRCLACDALLPPTALSRLTGVFLPKEEIPKPVDRPLSCPRCASGALRAKRIGQLPLQECRVCAGRWVAHAGFDRLMAVHGARALVQGAPPPSPSVTPDLAQPLRCPFCEEPLRRVNFAHLSQVVIDVCVRHGLWFDAGELEQIASFVEAGGLRRSRLRAQQLAAVGEPSLPVQKAKAPPEERAIFTPELVLGILEFVLELVVAMLG